MCDGFPCEFYDDYTIFSGDCTCLHEKGEHSWGSCGQEDPEGFICACEAGWEE